MRHPESPCRYFRIFIDAATLKLVVWTALSLTLFLFPHLYRCGHIEAYRACRRATERFRDFRIFIDAATLKPRNGRGSKAHHGPHFRIFIDAATLKPVYSEQGFVEWLVFPHLYRCGHIEASRLGPGTAKTAGFPHLYRCGHIEAGQNIGGKAMAFEFPHLYRCGHIEAGRRKTRAITTLADFRIFIDAATLKRTRRCTHRKAAR